MFSSLGKWKNRVKPKTRDAERDPRHRMEDSAKSFSRIVIELLALYELGSCEGEVAFDDFLHRGLRLPVFLGLSSFLVGRTLSRAPVCVTMMENASGEPRGKPCAGKSSGKEENCCLHAIWSKGG